MAKERAYFSRFFKQEIPAMNLSHRQVFELFQKSLDGQLSAQERARLDRHLATCAECQAHAALYHQLRKEAPAYRPVAVPSQQDVQQTIQKTQTRFRRRQMFKRFSNPVQAVAGAGIAVVLALAIVWIFNSPDQGPSQTQTGASVKSTPTNTSQVAALTPSPTPTFTPAPTAAPTLLPTPRPTSKPTAPAPMVGYTKEEVLADVDLNCDGLQERIVNIEAFYSSGPSGIIPQGVVGVALQVPGQIGYRQVWEYKTETNWYGIPTWAFYQVEFIPIGSCEQLLLTHVTKNYEYHLVIFRWDGRNMFVVLDVPGADYTVSTQDGLVVTVAEQNCLGIARCRANEVDYVWNGTEFILDR